MTFNPPRTVVITTIIKIRYDPIFLGFFSGRRMRHHFIKTTYIFSVCGGIVEGEIKKSFLFVFFFYFILLVLCAKTTNVWEAASFHEAFLPRFYLLFPSLYFRAKKIFAKAHRTLTRFFFLTSNQICISKLTCKQYTHYCLHT